MGFFIRNLLRVKMKSIKSYNNETKEEEIILKDRRTRSRSLAGQRAQAIIFFAVMTVLFALLGYLYFR
jgi:hypothetical protein